MKTILSRKTKAFVARDQDGSLYIYPGNRPKKDGFGVWLNNGRGAERIFDRNLFPEVKWEDEEPTEIDLEVSYKIKEWDNMKKFFLNVVKKRGSNQQWVHGCISEDSDKAFLCHPIKRKLGEIDENLYQQVSFEYIIKDEEFGYVPFFECRQGNIVFSGIFPLYFQEGKRFLPAINELVPTETTQPKPSDTDPLIPDDPYPLDHLQEELDFLREVNKMNFIGFKPSLGICVVDDDKGLIINPSSPKRPLSEYTISRCNKIISEFNQRMYALSTRNSIKVDELNVDKLGLRDDMVVFVDLAWDKPDKTLIQVHEDLRKDIEESIENVCLDMFGLKRKEAKDE